MIDAPASDGGKVGHAMFRYASSAERTAACVGFVRAGLAGNDAVLVAGTRALVEQLRSCLNEGAAGVTMAELPATGVDPGRLLAVIRAFAGEHAGQPVRLVQEVGWADRPAEELSEAIGYETLLRQALAGSAVRVLCGYHEQLGTSVLATAERAHDVLTDDGQCKPGGTSAGAPPGIGTLAQALSLPPGTAQVRTFRSDQVAVRQFAADQGRLAGLTRDRLTDLILVVGELAGNTLRHTAGPGTLMTWTTPGEFVCQVSDQGQIADPLAGTRYPDPVEIGGHRGLWLVHQVSDLVQLRSGPGGTTVRVHMRLPGH